MVLFICWSCIPSSSFGISKWLSNAYINSICTPHLYTPRNLRFLHLLTQKRTAFLHPEISRGHLGNIFHEYLQNPFGGWFKSIYKKWVSQNYGGAPQSPPEIKHLKLNEWVILMLFCRPKPLPTAEIQTQYLLGVPLSPSCKCKNPPTNLASLKTNHKPKNLVSSPFLWFTWGLEVQFLHSLN